MAALIRVGSIDDFSSSIASGRAQVVAAGVRTLDVSGEATDRSPLDFTISPENRGLSLKQLILNANYPGWFQRWFNSSLDIYFLAWAWDMKGVYLYPAARMGPEKAIIELQGGGSRTYIGDGALLFPPRKITAGLALRIQVWESNQDIREFGKVMTAVAKLVERSELNVLLTSGIALATGGSIAAVAAAQKAATELAKAIGNALTNIGDEQVDFFEGYFSAAQDWTVGTEQHDGPGCSIVLNRIQ